MYNNVYSVLGKEVRVLKVHHENGQGFLEYALIISLVAVVVIVILYFLGPTVGKIFSNVISII